MFVCLLFAKFSAPSYTRVRGLTIPSRAVRNNRVQQRSPILYNWPRFKKNKSHWHSKLCS